MAFFYMQIDHLSLNVWSVLLLVVRRYQPIESLWVRFWATSKTRFPNILSILCLLEFNNFWWIDSIFLGSVRFVSCFSGSISSFRFLLKKETFTICNKIEDENLIRVDHIGITFEKPRSINDYQWKIHPCLLI